MNKRAPRLLVVSDHRTRADRSWWPALAAASGAVALACDHDSVHPVCLPALRDRYELDIGPAAGVAGASFTPPVTTWPRPTGSYDLVALIDQLALVVDEEAAVTEAARVLRPGGLLIARVPAAGPLAWLDADNLYRYLHEATGRGLPYRETRGVGWRRHYRMRDLRALLAPRFHPRTVERRGLGVGEVVRFALLLSCRWLLPWEGGYQRFRRIADAIDRFEQHVFHAPFGYHLLITAERLPDPPPPSGMAGGTDQGVD